MKTVALIPIKLNNERVPQKNIKSFSDGTPLVSFIQASLLQCRELDEIYVYCSQDEIKEYLLSGVQFLRRDKRFDSQSVNVNEMFYAFSQDVPADIYVLAHATAPFQKAETIDEGIRKVKSGKYDSAIAVRKMQEFLWKEGTALNYDPKNIPRTQDLQPLYAETTGLYIYTNEVIVNNKSRIGNTPFMLEVSAIEAVDINNPVDFDIADAINAGIVHGLEKAISAPYAGQAKAASANRFKGSDIVGGNIQVLDSTLRDGGYCNNWEFGYDNIRKITHELVESGIDIVECGFINDCAEFNPDKSIFHSVERTCEILPMHNSGTIFVAMVNYGECDINHMPGYKEGYVKGIRLAFHKKDFQKAMKAGEMIKGKGYELFMQPMISLSYQDEEFVALIKACNRIKPYAFYIVDSFGVMKQRDLLRLFYIAEHNLMQDIAIGFHFHNNMQLAYANALSIINVRAKHKIIIDCCVYGMGRGAGNLNTELFVEYLNDSASTNYKLEPLFTIIDEVLDAFYRRNYWGYSLANYLSASYNAHPSYAGYLCDKHTLNVKEMNDIFGMMDDDKKVYFEQEYIEEIYLRYQSKEEAQKGKGEEFLNQVKGKTVLLIAPGRSSHEEKEKIVDFARNVISISINHDYPYCDTDFIFLSNLRRFKDLAENKRDKCIVSSNIPADKVYLQTEYKALLNDHKMVQDNAGLMAIKFLLNCGAQKIYLAGIDGYSPDIESNYGEIKDKFIPKKEVFDAINIGISDVLNEYANKAEIHFLTEQKQIKIKEENKMEDGRKNFGGVFSID